MSPLCLHLERLLQWLQEIGLQLPSRDIRIVEISQIRQPSTDGTYHVRRNQLLSPLEYESRFDKLLAKGYSWLNMSCYGVYDGLLIVAIEVPDPRTLYPGCPTSVNLSAPSAARILTIE